MFFFVPLIFPLGFFWVCLSRAVATGLLSLFHSLSFICHAPAGTGVFLFFCVCSSVSLLVSDPVFVGVSFSY